MNMLLRLIAIAALTTLLLPAGCGRGQPADDPHAGHDHGPGDSHADPADPHAGHDHAGPDAGSPDDHAEDGDDHAGEDDQDHAAHADEAPDVIRLDAGQLTEFGIRFAIAEPGVLRDTASLSGEIVLNPDRLAHVVARTGGIATDILHAIGDRIEVGATLAILESPGLAESKVEYLSKAAQAALAATDLARAETIHANTVRLLEIVANESGVDTLRDEISGLDIGANRGALVTAYAELQSAQAVYDRERILFDREISSESEFLNAESALKKALVGFQAVRDDLAFSNRRELDAARRSKMVADVSLQAAERRLHALGLDEGAVAAVSRESDTQLSRYEIRAPIAGRIIERHLVRGESLEAGEQIFVIADLSSVWGQLTLYQRDLAVVREGQTARVVGTHDVGFAEATIEYVSPILDERTRTTTARIVLDNEGGNWRPGMFIRAELAGTDRPTDVVVPRTALQEIDGVPVVFVAGAKGITRRNVELGQRDAGAVEIVAGLRPGERFAVTGGLALKAELNKAALEHAGHAH